MPKKRSMPPAFHLVGAMAAMALVAGAVLGGGSGELLPVPSARVTVEHNSAATLVVRGTSGKTPGLIAFSHDGPETVLLGVPESWAVQEVRNAPLSSVPSDPPSGGVRKWHLPSGVVLTLRTQDVARLTLANPSGVPLVVRHTLVPLASGEAEEDSVIVTKQPVTLW